MYEENEQLSALFEKVLHQKPKWFKDWGKWAAPCQLAPKALALHELIKKELPQTGRRINGVLDVTPYNNPAIEKLKFTLAASELQFETRADGILPRSIMVCAAHAVPQPSLSTLTLTLTLNANNPDPLRSWASTPTRLD